MTKMRLLKRSMRYNKQEYKQGDIIDVKDNHVLTLELAQIATRVDEVAPVKRKRGRPAGSIKKAGEKKTGRAKAATSKRTYNRRDMQAEK